MLSDNFHVLHKQTLLREHENFLSMHWILCGENLIPRVDSECLFCISFKCLGRDHLHVHYELTASSTKKKSSTAVQSFLEVIYVLNLKLLSFIDLTISN